MTHLIVGLQSFSNCSRDSIVVEVMDREGYTATMRCAHVKLHARTASSGHARFVGKTPGGS